MPAALKKGSKNAQNLTPPQSQILCQKWTLNNSYVIVFLRVNSYESGWHWPAGCSSQPGH